MTGGPLGLGVIGNGAQTVRERAQFTRVTVHQAEGLTGELKSGDFRGQNAEHHANRLLHEISATAPMTGYYKVDVRSTVSLGGKEFTFTARHDVSRFNTDDGVREHMARHFLYLWEHGETVASKAERDAAGKFYAALTGHPPKLGTFPWLDELKRQAKQGSGPVGLGVAPTLKHAVAGRPPEPPQPPQPRSTSIDRADAIRLIRAGLQARSGRPWSVTGGRGTAYGWLHIRAPPKRLTSDWNGGPTEPGKARYYLATADREELARLLGKEWVDAGGESVPSGSDHYREYIDRAEGRKPSVLGKRDWD